METPKNDVIEDNDDSIPELEELVECETVHPVSAGVLSPKALGVGEWIASRPWGQMLLKFVDRVLWSIERTMLWQNTCKDALVPMVTPKPNALVAYLLAAFLWVLQHLMFVTADQLIKQVQTRRRRLRAVRFLGIRNMRISNVLGRPVTSCQFAEIFWFLGLLSADRIAGKQESITDGKEVEERTTEDSITADTHDHSEQNKKRRFSEISVTTDEGTIFLDDDNYHSESDSDYVPECSHSSETSDSDSSSIDDDEEETNETELNQSNSAETTEKIGDLPTPSN